jgi:hypothetical protein
MSLQKALNTTIIYIEREAYGFNFEIAPLRTATEVKRVISCD